MQSTSDTDRATLYLGSDNEQEWSRLRRAVELTEGFALYLISVQDLSTAAELIRRLQRRLSSRTPYHFTIADNTEPTVADLLRHIMHLPPESLVILSGLDERKLPADFWLRFNERRNLWQRHSPYVHLWFVNSTIRQQIRTQAPDIYSIRSLDFLFTLPPSTHSRPSERQSEASGVWQGTADSLLAEAKLLATDQTPTGRLLYGRSLVPVVQRLRFEGRLTEALQISHQGLLLAEGLSSPTLQAAFLVEMGITEHRLSQLDAAQTHFQTALSLSRQAKEVWGEANTLKALGDLKVRVADLTGARHDYEAALPIYRDIQDRLGEANCRQGLGNLLVAEGKVDAAFIEFRTALSTYIDIHDSFGIGAILGYMGHLASDTKNHKRAVIFLEEALKIHQLIQDKIRQALDLHSQAKALWSLDENEGALAAWQQAREIFQRIQHPTGAQIEALFAKLAEQIPREEFQTLMAHLQTNGEEVRQQAVARVADMAQKDSELQEIRALLHQSRSHEKGDSSI